MTKNTTQYPLAWPPGFGRTDKPATSRFKTSISGALSNVREELRRFGKDTDKEVSDVLISSNVTLGEQRPEDGGVAVYFRWDNADCCIPVDRYVTPEANLQAIALIVEAERTKVRHGGLNIVRASFRGYLAIPPPLNGLAQPWRKVLGVHPGDPLDTVEKRYRELVKQHHPDAGGDPSKLAQIADAIRHAREEMHG